MTRTSESQSTIAAHTPPAAAADPGFHSRFMAEWDADGVFFYQAFNDAIADYAIEHQRFGGEAFNPTRMTWIKPSFGWVLYRSGYGKKPNQTRVLKIKLGHDAVAEILNRSAVVHSSPHGESLPAQTAAGRIGRIQWDPARDLFSGEKGEPRRMLRSRAIQIGMSGRLSEFYVENTVSIADVTALAHRVGQAHASRKGAGIADIESELPVETPYLPSCDHADLVRLALLPGPVADRVSQIGRGRATDAKK